MHVASDDEIEGWSLQARSLVLGVATVVTALVAEILVGSLEVFADEAGLTDFFVAAVIVAIVGNAAEHGGAVVVAARGKIKLATELPSASSAQAAVFLDPGGRRPSRGSSSRLPSASGKVEIARSACFRSQS